MNPLTIYQVNEPKLDLVANESLQFHQLNTSV
jgi:hypothetical protein